MRFKGKPLWIGINLLSLISLLLFVVGFSWAVTEIMGSATAPQPDENQEGDVSPAAPEGKPLLLSFGDSLTRGTGDTTGQGYFGQVRSALREQDNDVSAVNLGIKGQTSSELREQMKQPRIRQLLDEASWVTLTIGGNDLFRGSGSLEAIDLKEAAVTREEYEANLEAILKAIRQENADVPVFIFGLYNPFGDLEDRKTTDALVREWNQTMEKMAADDPLVVIIPLFDLFQLNPDRYLYTDKFHPNNDGYQLMAARLLQAMNALEETEVNLDAP